MFVLFLINSIGNRSIVPERIKRIPAKDIGLLYVSPILTAGKAVDHKIQASIANMLIFNVDLFI